MKEKKIGRKPQFDIPIGVEFSRYGTGESCILESVGGSELFNDSDFKTIAAICGEKLVYDTLFKERMKGKPYTAKDAKKFISWARDGWNKGEYFVFLVRNPEREIIAAVDIKSNNTDSAEVGYWSGSKTSGVMTNAVIALCDIAKQAGFKSLYGLTVPDNIKSQEVLIRAGFDNSGPYEEKGKSFIKFSKTLS